jgi:hypothetical protein
MFPDDAYGCFDKYPENKSDLAVFRLLFPFRAKIIKCLLHRLAKPFPKPSRIKSKELFIEMTNIELWVHWRTLENEFF